MCGIVGLFLKDPALEPRLGALLAEMLGVMSDRGPDSAGFAVYSAGREGFSKLTLRSASNRCLSEVAAGLSQATGSPVEAALRDTHLVVSLPTDSEAAARAWLAEHRPDVAVVGAGQRIELYKEVGLPSEVATRFGLAEMSGTHGIGHTRMATESAVTTLGAHPFSTGPDQCLVHNGSLSNHNSVRRNLAASGMTFETDNDSEVAAGYLTNRMRQGASLREALEGGLEDLDGFYTFVVATEGGFAVMRDPIACKPAVMAVTDQYVAFGSEYRALAKLPGVETARMFEPEPGRVYAWGRA
jgi:glutamate synthase domain-containing protein 1